MPNPREAGPASRTSVLAVLALACVLPVGAQAARPIEPPNPDPYGYVLVDQNDPRCEFLFVDVSVGGDPVQFSGGGADPDDEGGALLPLEEPFELYGAAITDLVVSANGYLAAAASLSREDGGDFSNDARLPAIPDNPPAIPARLMPYHDDLSGSTAGGAAASRYFGVCPRPSEALAGEPCTVVQWSDWSAGAEIDPFDLQAVLYHRSFEIVFQIRPGTSGLVGGTIGVQDAAATAASQYGNPGLVLVADTAVCVFDPRYPAGGPMADLRLINTDKSDEIHAGQPLLYAVSVINRGPSPAAGARVVDVLPAALEDCSWTCEASAGSSCAAAGSGGIDETVDVEPGGWVDYLLSCDASATATSVVHTASVSAPVGVPDPDPTNNSATDVDRVVRLPSGNCPIAPAVGPGFVWPAASPDADPTRCPTPRDAAGRGPGRVSLRGR